VVVLTGGVGATTKCAGVVEVREDGSFTCSSHDCLVGSDDPLEVVKGHGVFVPEDHRQVQGAIRSARGSKGRFRL